MRGPQQADPPLGTRWRRSALRAGTHRVSPRPPMGGAFASNFLPGVPGVGGIDGGAPPGTVRCLPEGGSFLRVNHQVRAAFDDTFGVTQVAAVLGTFTLVIECNAVECGKLSNPIETCGRSLIFRSPLVRLRRQWRTLIRRSPAPLSKFHSSTTIPSMWGFLQFQSSTHLSGDGTLRERILPDRRSACGDL
jgi:hypothetical protein